MRDDDDPAESFYCLDAEDRIIAWGGKSWAAFARENQGAHLATADLTGSSIYAHVSGHFTARFLKEFLVRARQGSTPCHRLYRCDSPLAKRRMEMRAVGTGRGGLRVEHRLLEDVPLPHPIEARPARVEDSAPFLRCSNCNQLRPPFEKSWLEPERAVPRADIVRVVHTVCPDCWRSAAA